MITSTRWLSAVILMALTAACSQDTVKPIMIETTEEQANASSGLLPKGPVTKVTDITADNIPAEIRSLAMATIPGMTINEVERKERDGRVFYDVEGFRPDGSEVEIDVLAENGNYTAVEIQRDISWADVPTTAVTATQAIPEMFTPARVIESIQNDGTIIYELFAPEKPSEPAVEVSLKDGVAKLLTERWAY